MVYRWLVATWIWKTYAVDVARGSLPLGIAIGTVGDLREGALDVRVDGGVLGDIDLVAVGVAIGPAGMSGLGAAGDGDGAAARALQGDHAADGARVDAVERSTGGVVLVRAATAGRPAYTTRP